MSINSLLLTSHVRPMCFLRGKNKAQLALSHPLPFCAQVVDTRMHTNTAQEHHA